MFIEEKAKGEVPDFKLGTLKLSTAIRLGCSMAPQSHIGLFVAGSTCAQGAALMGLGGGYGDARSWSDRLRKQIGGDPMAVVPDGNCAGERLPLIGPSGAIASLNDVVGGVMWSREKIADWLESEGY